MPDTITLTSTTDTEQDVRSALGLTSAEAPKEPVPAEPPAPAPEPVAETPVVPAQAEEDDAEEADDPVPQAAGGKKRGKLQARINELIRERNEVNASRQAERAELDAYRKKVAELISTAPAAKVAEVAPVKAKGEPDLPTMPKVEDFQTYEDYTIAVAKWAAKSEKAGADPVDVKSEIQKAIKEVFEAERKTAAEARQKEHFTKQAQQYQAQANAARDKYDDFDEVVGNPAIEPTPLLLDQLRGSEVGAEVAYYLGTHLDECKKLIALGNSAQAIKAFGKIEAKVEQSLDAASKAATAPTAAGGEGRKTLASVAPSAGKPVVTKAPDPITPVGGNASGTTTEDPNTMPYQEFVAWRNRNLLKRAGLK
jgi:hypothetical protein